ncbi:unnamed protein product [Heterobilharzia americana]|nr:unnamed protein product [Heterobilharzia americana]
MYRGLNSEACVDSNGNRRNTKKSNKNKHGSLDDIDSSESQDDAHDGVEVMVRAKTRLFVYELPKNET